MIVILLSTSALVKLLHKYFPLFNVSGKGDISKLVTEDPIMADIQLDGYNLCVEVDSAATVTMIHRLTFQKWWPKSTELQPVTGLYLGDINDKDVRILGMKKVQVNFNGKTPVLPLVIVDGCKNHSLLGRNWFKLLGISLCECITFHYQRVSLVRPIIISIRRSMIILVWANSKAH